MKVTKHLDYNQSLTVCYLRLCTWTRSCITISHSLIECVYTAAISVFFSSSLPMLFVSIACLLHSLICYGQETLVKDGKYPLGSCKSTVFCSSSLSDQSYNHISAWEGPQQALLPLHVCSQMGTKPVKCLASFIQSLLGSCLEDQDSVQLSNGCLQMCSFDVLVQSHWRWWQRFQLWSGHTILICLL